MKRTLFLACILMGCVSSPERETIYMMVQPDASADAKADVPLEAADDQTPDVDVDGPDADSEPAIDAPPDALPDADPDAPADHADEADAELPGADAPSDAFDEPPACTVDDWRCEGDALQLCDGVGWNLMATCQPGLCDVAGHQCDVCVAGASECIDEVTVKRCSADGQSETTTACSQNLPWCAAGFCAECVNDAHCPATTSDCQQDVCLSNACSVQPRASGIVCQNGSGKCDGLGHCAVCSPGEKRCVGNYPEICNPTGQWETQLQCVGFTPHCVAGDCRACLGTAGPSMVRTPLGYCVDSTEVTRDQYAAWLATTPTTSGQPSGCSANASFEPDPVCMASPDVCQGASCGNRPQVCVDWCDAHAYCAAVGKRLCGQIGGGDNPYMGSDGTDEWVQACSSGGVHSYPYGNVYNASACAVSGAAQPVPSKTTCQSSEDGWSGIFDMSGNVSEWENACDDANNVCRVRGCSVGCNQQALACTATFVGSDRLSTYNARGFRCCGN